MCIFFYQIGWVSGMTTMYVCDGHGMIQNIDLNLNKQKNKQINK